MKKITPIALLLTALMISGCGKNDNTTSNPDGSSPIVNTSSTGNTNNGDVIEAKYRINFYTDGGSNIPQIIAKAGAPIDWPENPTKANFSFDGWYRDYGTYKNEYTNFDTMPSENLTLYAKWKKAVIQVTDPAEYEASVKTWSKENHLYIHYYRYENNETDYRDWNLWIWQSEPVDSTGREVEWMEENGSLKFDDYTGVVGELDLTKTYNDGGNEGNVTVSYTNDGEICTEIGFLIVYKDSKNSGDHWKSDCGGNKFFYTDAAKWDDGSYHVFIIQDSVEFKHHYEGGEIPDNPYDNDDGTNTSDKLNNVDFTKKYDIAKTSEEFYNNVGTGYQVMVSSFADSDGDGFGDIKGITDHLDYFTDVLHINALWLTPVQQSDSYHGYDISDYCAVDKKYGSKNTNFVDLLDDQGRPTGASAMADYLELLERAEEKGIKIIMDLVINHTSINNLWFQRSASLVEEYRGYYQWENHDTNTSLSNEWHEYSTSVYSYYGKFATSMPELNYSYQNTRDAIVDVGLFWLEKGVDGFRIDAVKHIYMADEVKASSSDTIIKDTDEKTKTDYSSNLTKNLHFFREFNARLKEHYPNAFIVGENFDGHAYQVAPYYEGLDSMLNFYMYYNLSQAAVDGKENENYGKAKKVSGGGGAGTFTANTTGSLIYGGTWDYPGTKSAYNKYRGDNKAIDSLFTSNHDIARMMNNMVGKLISEDNLDATTNKVSSSNAAAALKSAKVYASTVMTLPGISWIYYGDELGMSGNNDDGSTAHADRCYRQPFKWAKNKTSETTGFTFSGDKTYGIGWDSYNATIDGVEEQKVNSSSILSEFMKLTKLKSGTKALINGSYQVINVNSKYVFAFKRVGTDGTYYCFHNFGSTTVNISGYTGTPVYTLNGATTSSLPGYSAIVIKA